MRKLKLESLLVESFETAPMQPLARGTVGAHAKPPITNNPDACGYTNYMECTYGCSRESACPDNCVIYSDFECV